MAQSIYKGFSSFEFERIKKFDQYDVEIVKTDLLNHIFTRRGSRVMMPTFGTLIPEMIFEPLDGSTIATIEEELFKVINYDPRVELLDMRVVPNYDKNAVTAIIEVFYIELNLVDDFELNIEFEG